MNVLLTRRFIISRVQVTDFFFRIDEAMKTTKGDVSHDYRCT